jgi:L-ribulokinase
MPITVIKSAQGPALGSAIHAAVAAGAYKDIVEASAVMGGVSDEKFIPIEKNVKVYERLFTHYDKLYEDFGHNHVMHDLRNIRDSALLQEVK